MPYICSRTGTRASALTDSRLNALYEADGFGGETTMRAKVIRELIDEIRTLRGELVELGRQGTGATENRIR